MNVRLSVSVSLSESTTFPRSCRRVQNPPLRKIRVRTVKYFKVSREGNLVTVTVAADGFLYNMVRIMVGTYIDCAEGRLCEGDVAAIIEKKDRSFAGDTAPACGLYLNKVFY